MSLMNMGSVSENLNHMESIPNQMILEYLSVSIVLGIALMLLAVWSSRKIETKLQLTKDNTDKSSISSYGELVLQSANVLFLCFGMTGIMILVNNNLARAFAIGAAIAVIRFRVKFDSNGLGSTLFFAVLIGMACGVGQIQTAIGITLAYGVLQTIVILLIGLEKPTTKTSNTKPSFSDIN